jgi:hypothetical protein
MYKSIILNRNTSLKERLKNIISYLLKRRSARIQWKRRFRLVKKYNPNLMKPIEKSDEIRHRNYWKSFFPIINLATIRLSSNISGIVNYKYIPEEIFIADVEPTLNNNPYVGYFEYKSFYNHWFPGNIFPCDYFHNINGEWLSEGLDPITFSEVRLIARNLSFPVVLKPNRDTYGGKNVFFPNNYDELIKLAEKHENFLVQEKIIQHEFFKQFNPASTNTVRVNIYRSVTDNKLHTVNMALRMGIGKSLDNETAGGIVSMIRPDGYLNGFALDKYGKKYDIHPETGIKFDKHIPHFEELKNVSKNIAKKIFYTRLVSLDLVFDISSRWRMIEININSCTIRFAQYHGHLFFGEYSDEVYNYCLNNHWALH